MAKILLTPVRQKQTSLTHYLQDQPTITILLQNLDLTIQTRLKHVYNAILFLTWLDFRNYVWRKQGRIKTCPTPV